MPTRRKPSEVLAMVDAVAEGFDLTALAASLIREFGGPAEFAHRFFKEYEGGVAGSVARQKQLESVLRIFVLASHKAKPADDEADMTDAELADTLRRILDKPGANDAVPATPAEATPPGP